MSDEMDRNVLEMPENLITGLALYQYRSRALSVLAERDALRAENERMLADKDRLDWIEKHALSVDLVADPDGLVQVWYETAPPQVSAAKGVRAAIDAAMKASGSPESP